MNMKSEPKRKILQFLAKIEKISPVLENEEGSQTIQLKDVASITGELLDESDGFVEIIIKPLGLESKELNLKKRRWTKIDDEISARMPKKGTIELKSKEKLGSPSSEAKEYGGKIIYNSKARMKKVFEELEKNRK